MSKLVWKFQDVKWEWHAQGKYVRYIVLPESNVHEHTIFLLYTLSQISTIHTTSKQVASFRNFKNLQEFAQMLEDKE